MRENKNYPPCLTIDKLKKIKNNVLNLPPSKAVSIRGLYLPLLGIKKVILENIPDSDDFNVNLDAVQKLGVEVKKHEGRIHLINNNEYPLIPKSGILDIGNSGLGIRFLITLFSFLQTKTKIKTGKQLAQRPLLQDCEHLLSMGAKFKVRKNFLYINSTQLKVKTRIKIKTSITSQYLSALLFFGWKYGIEQIKLTTHPLSFSYIKTTLKLLKCANIVWKFKNNTFYLKKKIIKKEVSITIPPDASIASNFLVLACILAEKIVIKNFKCSSDEPDFCVLKILKKIGATYRFFKNDLFFTGKIKKTHLKIDLRNNPDLLPPLAIMSLFLYKGGILKNIGHTRFKESERNKVIVKELSKLQIKVEEFNNNLVIPGAFYNHTSYLNSQNVPSAILDCHNDPRIFMAFAILGCVIGNITIKNPHSLLKTFPDFLKYLY
ncbi:MAG: hypothetical protein ACK4NF_00370 [Planctomycetota bacterium]